MFHRLKRRQKSLTRRRIGNSLRAEGVEVHLVVAPQFQTLQPRAAGQGIVGDVQHVVRFVTRKGKLEQVDLPVDPLSFHYFPRRVTRAFIALWSLLDGCRHRVFFSLSLGASGGHSPPHFG
jgi:hypothetical protein